MEITANAAASSGSVLNAGLSSRASKSEIADGTIVFLYFEYQALDHKHLFLIINFSYQRWPSTRNS